MQSFHAPSIPASLFSVTASLAKMAIPARVIRQFPRDSGQSRLLHWICLDETIGYFPFDAVSAQRMSSQVGLVQE